MPILSFKKQFAELVETGQKRQTIRKMRKYPIKVDDRLYLYTGLRTKQCRKLGESIASYVPDIMMRPKQEIIIVNNNWLSDYEIEILAKNDGFDNVDDFFMFFREYERFIGQLIRWDEIFK